MSLFVSCPNNTIAGSVERDGRNNAEILIKGTINKPLTDSRKFTITLNNATFRAFSRGEDVSSWFVDSEGKSAVIGGLKYRIANPVASGSSKATVRITGTPNVASKDQIHLLIPCDTFQGPVVIDVDTEGTLRYDIIDYIEPTLTLIKEEGNNLVVDGMETKAIDTKRIKFQLNNAHFANGLKGNISYADGGDGTIIGAKSGGVNFTDATDSTHLDFKWEIIENPDGDNTEIDLVITGTADTLRSLDKGDTFTITLKESLLYDGTDADGINSTPTIIDDNNGEAYVKDIKVVKDGTTTPEQGVYNFTEVVPTLVLVEKISGNSNYLSSWNKLAKKEISGTTDKTAGLEFSSVQLYYLLSDATVTIANSPTVNVTSDNGDNLFGEGFSKTGLGGSISVQYSVLKDDNGTDITNSPVLFSVVISKGTGDLHVSEGDFNFVLTDELITTFGIKKTGVTETYDKSIKSSGVISIKIEEPKPTIAKKENSRDGVYFTATTLDVVADNPYNGANGVNGGVIKLQNYSTFRYKAEYATGEEVKIDGENSLVKIEPTYDYMTYYYKILTSTEDSDQASIQLYVKKNPNKYEDDDVEEGLLTPPSIDVTYTDPTGTNSVYESQNKAYGDFDTSKKDKYQVQVTLSPKLFEQVDTGEVATQVEGDTETKWKNYTGSDVVITKESNWVRYRIREKKTIPLNFLYAKDLDAGQQYQNMYISNIVKYKDSYGNIYNVDYSNKGIVNLGGEFLRFRSGGYVNYNNNDDSNAIWAVIPNALPKSSVGSLNRIYDVQNYDEIKTKFNTPVSNDSGNLYFRFNFRNNINGYNNVSLNRFQIVGSIPTGYKIDLDNFTENDIRIFNAVKRISYFEKPGRTYPTLYNSDEMTTINKLVKFKVALDENAGSTARIPVLEYRNQQTWNVDMSGNVPFYVYLDEFNDENSELTNIIKGYYEEKRYASGYVDITKPSAPVLAYLDIRINPSKLIDTTTGNPWLSKKKAEKTIDGSVYNGDTSKLKNGDMWLSIAQSVDRVPAKKNPDDNEVTAYYKPIALKIYAIPKQYEVEGQTYKSLSWQYRIMDRADYTYLTALPFTPPEEGNSLLYKTNYRHSQTSLSVNADMTTGLTKNLGKGLTLEADGKSYGFGEKQLQKNQYDSSKIYSSFVLPLNFSSYSRYGINTNYQRLEGLTDNSDYAKAIDRDLPYDNRSIPIRELLSGSFTQDVYNKDNAQGRTISGSNLLNIARKASRKGYRVKGFSRGRNHFIMNSPITAEAVKATGTTNIFSDLIPYKGVDDFGDTVDWEIYWNGNVMNESSQVFEKGITLGLTDSAAYREYIYPRDNSAYGLSDSSFADWYNTTYIYLVWEPDPYSIYYNKDTTNITMGDVQFVRIPGELQWPGYRNPYYIRDEKLVNVDYRQGPYDPTHSSAAIKRDGISEDVAKEFESVRRVADNDYAI